MATSYSCCAIDLAAEVRKEVPAACHPSLPALGSSICLWATTVSTADDGLLLVSLC